MQDPRRAALSRMVNECRRTLVGDRSLAIGDLGEQLEAPYGFDRRTGVPRPVREMPHLRSWQVGTAEMLRQWHAHLVSTGAGHTEAERARSAYDQMKYELGYTVLHRLCALRMAEERGVIRSCVGNGRDSDGFKLYVGVLGHASLGTHDEAFGFFVQRVYDELARELPAVFDRRTPASLLVPRPAALEAVLAELNAPEVSPLWTEDETLGWIFEDYNDAEERKEMRKHDAPRNARELAVRNQFFTPRWVVEFLTDNTVGRLWYDLNGGQTELAETCRFLARTSDAPAAGEPRDPRDITVLDPACGSGHFLLYVFDLLERIYREAWRGRRQRSATRTPLWEEYPNEQAFLAELPRLILAENLFGVDIDPRCIQEAALALWLRAHKSWRALGLRAGQRPSISKVNLVCAQAMPNAPEVRAELIGKLKPAVLGRLVEALLAQAGEMGVLLRAETAMADTIEAVKKEYRTWELERRTRDPVLLQEVAKPRQVTLDDVADVSWASGDGFWSEADARLNTALEGLLEDAGENERYAHRLFAEDLRHGLEFFELGRRRFDVVLMNPPFGEPSESTKEALDAAYPNAGHELYAMFYERALEMLAPGGRVGAITNRSWLALPTLGPFRRNVLGNKGTVELGADLGYGVLNAKVETAAAVLRIGGWPDFQATWVRLVKTGRKLETLLDALARGQEHPAVSVVSARRFESLPATVYGYWMSEEIAKTFATGRPLGSVADVKQGTATADDPRFLRLAWEVSPGTIGLESDWARFAKGGEYRPFFDDVHLVIRWKEGGKEIAAFPKAYIRNPRYYGKRGVTWPLRNQQFGPRALPAGCAFGHKRPSAIPNGVSPPALLGVLAAKPLALLLAARLGISDDDPKAISPAFEVGLIRDLPYLPMDDATTEQVGGLALNAAEIVRHAQLEDDAEGETVTVFVAPPTLLKRAAALEESAQSRVTAREVRLADMASIGWQLDTIIAKQLGFSDRERKVMDEEFEPAVSGLPGGLPIDEDQFRTAYLTKVALDGSVLPGGLDAEVDIRVEHRRRKQVRLRDEAALCRLFDAPPAQIAQLRQKLGLLRPEDLRRCAADIVSYAVGVAFGRWDVRLCAHPEWIATFADPFDLLPPCPLGQLVNAEGLPAIENRIASEAWLAARTHPTELPAGAPAQWEVDARSYPLALAWDGLLVDDLLDDARPRRPSTSFLSRVDAVFEHLFGAKRPEWEADIAHALGEKSIADWLRSPTGFFADHLGRYSKSRRVAPIYWPITTPSGGITFWVYAPRLDHGTLPGIINQLRADMEPLRNERDRLKAAGNGDRAQGLRALQLARDCAERQALHDALSALVTRGFAPHPDDGFVVTASPLYATFRLAKWRELLRETFASLEKGDLDWAHLAMRFRPKQVREKCKTDSSLAIAHGLESACAPVRKQGRKKVSPPQARAVQPSGSAAMKQEELIPRAGSKGARWSG